MLEFLATSLPFLEGRYFLLWSFLSLNSSIYRLVRKFSEAAGIDKVVSPHRIRHSAITAYLDASDGNIRAAQSLSRHANLNTLNRYDDNRHKYQAQATNTLADLV